MVFYRTYRPQTISELDLQGVSEKLTALLSSGNLPHAFLFTGSKGLGKTSSARILAKAINCKNRNQESRIKNQGEEKNKNKGHNSELVIHDSNIEPCNKCEICTSITAGNNIDVLEIDAASNGGVDEMRSLREKVKFSSSTLDKKVYIIDEVHMLSTGAFNALLKTLEEPPSHVVFVLCTTELSKLPATVVSRTFQIQFEKPTEAELVSSLKRIVKGERLRVEKGVLEAIFLLADGSFRDGAKILEELSLLSKGEEITKELIDKVFKTKSIGDDVHSFLESLSEKDVKKALSVIANIEKSGGDFKLVIERMAEQLRGMLLLRNGFESNERDIAAFSLADIHELLEMVTEAYSQLKYSVLRQLPLEMLAVKWCVILAKQESRIMNFESGITSMGAVDMKESKKEVREEGAIKVLDEEEKTNDKSQITNNQTNFLRGLFEEVNKENKQAAAFLRSCKSAEVEGGTVFIKTPYPIHAEKLNTEKLKDVLEASAAKILGKKMRVSVTVLTK